MVESSLQSAKATSFGIFVPSKNGLRKLTDDLSNTSILGIAEYLGYHENQIHASFGVSNEVEPEITAIAWEVFSTNIIFVLTKSSVSHLSDDKINNFMKDFNYNSEYESMMIEETLLSGIENKSLKIGFLCRIFDIEHKPWDDYILFEKIGVRAFFVNGYLAAFEFVDEELGEWARSLKRTNPDGFADYSKVAERYWKGDYDKIIFEVNAQFEAWANTPDAASNQHVPLHTTRFNTINFVMLLVCHYEKHIDIEQFEAINHGRYKKISESGESIIYECGNFIYEFDREGLLASRPRLKSSLSTPANWSSN